MTFAAPLFLLASLAAAIPIALHLISRRKAKESPFSTLRFLKASVEKTRRRQRIHDALLMAIRAAALLLVALGLARPAVTRLGSLWGGAQTAAVIVLDNSASMGAIDGDRPRLETAAASALQILDQLVEGDQAALLPSCGPPLPDAGKFDRTQDSIRQLLGQCRASYERADLPAKLRQARELLARSESPNKQIYVLGDMQRASWEIEGKKGSGVRGQGSDAENPKSPIPNPQSPIPLILVDCNRTPKPNVAVQSVDVDAATPLAGVPIKAAVTLQSTSAAAQQRIVELLIDGVRQSSSPELNVPPLGRAKHEFTFALAGAGLHRGEAHLIGQDGLKQDDRRFFIVEVDRGIPVAVVKTRRHEIAYLDDGFYLQRALASGGGAFQVTTLTADRLADESLEKYKVLFCVNLPAPTPETAQRLAAYIAGGGRVVWTCGDNVRPDAYNAMNRQAGGRLLPAPLVDVRVPHPQDRRDSWHVGFLDSNRPALSSLISPPALYESVLVYKHVRMDAKAGDLWTLARLDDGEPLLVERSIGGGRSLMLGTGVHVNWSNLPLRPIFLPLVTRLTLELAEAEPARTSLVAGEPIVLPLPASAKGVELIPPSGETLRLFALRKGTVPFSSNENGDSPPFVDSSVLTGDSDGATGGRGLLTFRYANTHEVGVYRVRLLTDPPRETAYAVNFDPDETDPAKIDREELRERLGGASVIFADNPDDLSGTFALLREGKSLWTPLLAAVLLVLVFETFWSNVTATSRP